ncbi:hypothetical protein [Streptomyces purpureus]|uniref:Uncharacterized protein n=1 Tax=Streptomyces purpureus TaxID=1951 RepID=A0A918HK96_9ACTN|nr:hypothetical protein [Streptomyces purpureus]GGT65374.1 hypothetical protein GCM10014713_67890 [Streptomyces purpureus]
MTTTHFTAWLTNTPSALDQPNVDLTVLEDVLIGDPDDGDSAWASAGGEAAFEAITSVPAEDDDDEQALREAKDLLQDAGWRTVGEWDGVETGYIVTVERI